MQCERSATLVAHKELETHLLLDGFQPEEAEKLLDYLIAVPEIEKVVYNQNTNELLIEHGPEVSTSILALLLKAYAPRIQVFGTKHVSTSKVDASDLNKLMVGLLRKVDGTFHELAGNKADLHTLLALFAAAMAAQKFVQDPSDDSWHSWLRFAYQDGILNLHQTHSVKEEIHRPAFIPKEGFCPCCNRKL